MVRRSGGINGPVPGTTLPPHPTSAAAARRFVADVLLQGGFPTDAVHDAVLLTSEAVANAVVHAGTVIDLVVVADPSMARIEVHDRHPGFPVVRDDSPDAVSGRGLRVVQALAEAWGVDRGDASKCVWFEVRA